VSVKHEVVSRHYVQQFDDVVTETTAADSQLLMLGLSPSHNARSVTQS